MKVEMFLSWLYFISYAFLLIISAFGLTTMYMKWKQCERELDHYKALVLHNDPIIGAEERIFNVSIF